MIFQFISLDLWFLWCLLWRWLVSGKSLCIVLQMCADGSEESATLIVNTEISYETPVGLYRTFHNVLRDYKLL